MRGQKRLLRLQLCAQRVHLCAEARHTLVTRSLVVQGRCGERVLKPGGASDEGGDECLDTRSLAGVAG